MATFIYNHAKEELLDGTLDPSADDLGLTLILETNTVQSQYDELTLDGFTNLGEHDGATFARIQVAGVSMLGNVTGVNGYARLDATDTEFVAPGASSGDDTVGALLYGIRGAAAPDGLDTSNIPIAFFDLGSFSTGSGSTVTVQWSTDGMLQVA